ncbi:MAG TPA: SDR family oxidoreductase [Micromonosporaceae bacterium]
MKIVVIGGTGLIGRQVVSNLIDRGHDAVAASPNSGVNTITGEGLDAVLTGADVVVDLANSPSFAGADVLEFFQTSGRNLLKAEAAAGVGHHVALTIVGADRVPDSGYMRAKVAQERVIEAANVPYTIVRSTQFFEFLRAIADAGTEADVVRVPTATLQPIAAHDVAAAVTDVAVAPPANATIEIAGPAAISFAELVCDVLAADQDPRTVVGDARARYFGTELTDGSITAGPDARLGQTTFAEWLAADGAKVPTH